MEAILTHSRYPPKLQQTLGGAPTASATMQNHGAPMNSERSWEKRGRLDLVIREVLEDFLKEARLLLGFKG